MYDWIHHAPAIGVLLINLIFLFVIMWVLITKLRSAQTVETQQYRKAAKALLVLIPLLGITYVLLMDGPHEGVSGSIYGSVRAILISTQGFTVALFYCFLNTEVQNTLRHHKEPATVRTGHHDHELRAFDYIANLLTTASVNRPLLKSPQRRLPGARSCIQAGRILYEPGSRETNAGPRWIPC
ncbi:Diuretic hormone 44 receptor 1 [Carabus blaptoides fortunei]